MVDSTQESRRNKDPLFEDYFPQLSQIVDNFEQTSKVHEYSRQSKDEFYSEQMQ